MKFAQSFAIDASHKTTHHGPLDLLVRGMMRKCFRVWKPADLFLFGRLTAGPHYVFGDILAVVVSIALVRHGPILV
jgi:hypothetical protein